MVMERCTQVFCLSTGATNVNFLRNPWLRLVILPIYNCWPQYMDVPSKNKGEACSNARVVSSFSPTTTNLFSAVYLQRLPVFVGHKQRLGRTCMCVLERCSLYLGMSIWFDYCSSAMVPNKLVAHTRPLHSWNCIESRNDFVVDHLSGLCRC